MMAAAANLSPTTTAPFCCCHSQTRQPPTLLLLLSLRDHHSNLLLLLLSPSPDGFLSSLSLSLQFPVKLLSKRRGNEAVEEEDWYMLHCLELELRKLWSSVSSLCWSSAPKV
ncbi:putative sec-independent protein translocase protein TATB, chloroplastic isoform X3 [Iris pallida]|uniref:Sec-independent protein translocase protein TATB, chloroplastic isoform X3 n=1 Tax=Iris pallida TaxID=29817 RepID=A0AAX6HQJ4_IRIPA|nr:putative sec-independent protein translocase protein TATB, chloroplastic isoform X3 [Iris pallida]